MSPTPVFLFSMPRGGSTWLQRLMGSHAAIATTNEPWFLLPLIYMRRRRGISSVYWQDTCGKAVSELLAGLDDGEEVFRDAIRAFATRIHSAAARNGERYFLDKTPRYALVADEILHIFPDARFIFLWRNPLSVLSSMLELSGGRWLVPRFDIDLVEGWPKLVDLASSLGERAHCVRYEDLLSGRDQVLQGIFDHLDLPFDPAMVEENRSGLQSERMGDRKSEAMHGLDHNSRTAGWRCHLQGPLRRRWSRHYLEALGEERLAFMGYSAADLDLASLAPAFRPGEWLSDLCCWTYARAFHGLNLEYPLKRAAKRWRGLEHGRPFGMI